MNFIFAQMQPIPRDIPIEMPLPAWLLAGILIFAFLLHILFVNLMVGGSILTLVTEILGLKNEKYDRLAKKIGSTITVNKSLAVVLGVAPLLAINTLYTVYFYSANVLTGTLWISIVPLVTLAFLLSYWHKYSWDKYQNKKKQHIAIVAVSAILFLFIPLIFLTNVNLMLFPEKWGEVEGFFSALMLRNVFPRYFHFLAGSLAITGLFLFWYFNRKNYTSDEAVDGFSKYELKKKSYKFAFYVTLSNLAFGPLLLFTLPWRGVEWNMVYFIIGGIILAAIAMYIVWKELKGPAELLGKRFYLVISILTVTVILMGTGRHIYRENVVSPHQEKMIEKTEQYYDMESIKGDVLKRQERNDKNQND
jgi:cytochrome c